MSGPARMAHTAQLTLSVIQFFVDEKGKFTIATRGFLDSKPIVLVVNERSVGEALERLAIAIESHLTAPLLRRIVKPGDPK